MYKTNRNLLYILSLVILAYSGYAQKKATAYFFMLEDCVICQSYTPVINELYSGYQDEIDFLLVFPNQRSRKDSIDQFMNKYQLKMPSKTDHYKNLSLKFGVKVTPEVVLVSKDGTTLYQGSIDDGYAGIGKKRKVRENYLRQAIIHFLNNEPIQPATTQAFGCFINYKENN